MTASADDYTSGTTQIRIAGTQEEEAAEEEEEEEEEAAPVSEPDSVSIVGPSQREGTANTALDAALIVQVVDDAGDAVADASYLQGAHRTGTAFGSWEWTCDRCPDGFTRLWTCDLHANKCE